MSKKQKRLTSDNGRPVGDNQNIQTAGLRGPAVMQDPWYFEKLGHFDREVIPERRMHAKGSGAYGTFTVTHDITRYTRASIFARVGKQTEVFARFSTVAGERGAADAERDIRGFALKFYTDAGNWDLVGNNTPVFFLRDPLKFPDLNHAIKRDPRTGMRSVDNNWDFWTLLPEALHQVTITMSPRGIPRSFRHMHGFGSHTYSFYDAENRRTWVKFHFRTLQGIENLTDAQAEAVIAKDRESNQRDLFEAIERGDYPRWLMQVQLMTEEEARTYPINPFDLTKVWYHGDFPLHDVGILELNRNPENFFAEVEQAAFSPMNLVEGIGLSPDKMLQGRLFSYGDAQRYRLGVNFSRIPVNRPHVEVHDYHRDGRMRTDGNFGAAPAYEPNSFGEWRDTPAAKEPPLETYGPVDNYDEREYDDDYYTQPGKLWRLMTPADRAATCGNTARAMGDAKLFIKQRHVRNCYYADPAYGEGVARALGIDLREALEAPDPARPAWDKRRMKTPVAQK
ncbi:MAG: catalase [Alistipes sp.]|nr:catalase [Alistipes sp.]